MNIIKNIKISIYQIYQCVFKPATFSKSIDDLDKKNKIELLLKLSFFSFIISVVIVGVVRAAMFSFGYPFGWIKILAAILLFIAFGIVFDRAGGIAGCIAVGIVFGIAFLFSYFRAFYILPQAVQYLRAKVLGNEPFGLFRNSPIYWDEAILIPLPFLSDFLVTLANANREKGLSEIEFVSSERFAQRKAAFSALLEITINDLSRLKSINKIADASAHIPHVVPQT